jgi:hypothetical protein
VHLFVPGVHLFVCSRRRTMQPPLATTPMSHTPRKKSSWPLTSIVAPPSGPFAGLVFALARGTPVPKASFIAWTKFVNDRGGRLIHADEAKLDVTDGGAVTHGRGLGHASPLTCRLLDVYHACPATTCHCHSKRVPSDTS